MPVKACAKEEDVWTITIKTPVGELGKYDLECYIESMVDSFETDGIRFHLEGTKDNKQQFCFEQTEKDHIVTVSFVVSAIGDDEAWEKAEEAVKPIKATATNVSVDEVYEK